MHVRCFKRKGEDLGYHQKKLTNSDQSESHAQSGPKLRPILGYHESSYRYFAHKCLQVIESIIYPRTFRAIILKMILEKDNLRIKF